MADAAPVMRAKRKRATISYAEIDDDDFGDAVEGDVQSDTASSEPDFDAHGADIAFGSKKVRHSYLFVAIVPDVSIL